MYSISYAMKVGCYLFLKFFGIDIFHSLVSKMGVCDCWVGAQSPTSITNEKTCKFISMDNIQLV